jgi:mannosyltransferase
MLGARQQDTQQAWVDPISLGRLAAAPGEIAGSDRTAWLLVGLALLTHWRPGSRLVPVALLALSPVTVVGLVSVFISPMWVPRYLLVALFPLAMLAAVAVAGQLRADGRSAGLPALRLLLVLALLAGTAFPGQLSVRGPTAKNGPDYRGIAHIVQQHQLPGDGMVFETRSRAMRAGMEYYLRRQPTFPRDLLQRRSAAEAGQLMADEDPDPAARVAGTPRVWLIVGGPRKDPATRCPALRPLLRQRYVRIGIWQARWATVALYRYRG